MGGINPRMSDQADPARHPDLMDGFGDDLMDGLGLLVLNFTSVLKELGILGAPASTDEGTAA
jgi:hypothetical protein